MMMNDETMPTRQIIIYITLFGFIAHTGYYSVCFGATLALLRARLSVEHDISVRVVERPFCFWVNHPKQLCSWVNHPKQLCS